MIVAMLPMGSITASAVVSDTGSFTVNGIRANTTEIVFGGQNWFVIGYNGTGAATESGSMTMLAKDYLGPNVAFHNTNNNYAGSWLKSEIDKLSGLSSAGQGGLFTQAEQDAIKKITLPGGSTNIAGSGMAGADVTNAILWPLDVAEANSVNVDIIQGPSFSSWWLRSPGQESERASVVQKMMMMDFEVNVFGGQVPNARGVRPAFKLNLSSVLFASAAVGGKSGVAGNNLSAVAIPSVAQKLTILDTANHALTTATTSNAMTAESTITVSYDGASTDKTLSAIVANKTTGLVTHYGKLVASVAATSGTATVTLPAGFDGNTMELKLFTETINADNLTDYASTPVTVTSVNNEVKNESELSNAITAATTDGSSTTIKLGESFSSSTQIITNKNIILDLNGYTITSTSVVAAIELNGTASLEVKDTSPGAVGVLSGGNRAIWNQGNGAVVISGGTVTSNALTISNAGSGSVTVSGGTVSTAGSSYAIWNQGDGSVTVSGGTVTSNSIAISNDSSGSVTVSGGTVSGAIYTIQSNGIVNVSGGTLLSSLGISILSYGTSNIVGGTLANVNTSVLNISGNPTLTVNLSALTSKKVSITGALTGEEGKITLNAASLSDKETGTVVATATDANHANASKFVLTNATGKTLMKSGGDIVFAAEIPTVPTIGTLNISNTFTAGHNIELGDLETYKPTVTANNASITEQGWQFSVTYGGSSDSWSKWTVGVLSPTTTSVYKLRYYVTYGGTTITSNEVTLNVVGNTTTLVLTASPSSPQNTGTPITLTATLTGFLAGPGLTGQNIIFKNGSATLGTAALNAGGVATYIWTPGSVGTDTLTAEYAATDYNTGATSNVAFSVTAPIQTYTVTFDSQGGTSLNPATGITLGSLVDYAPSPLKAGYTFGGWYREATCTNQWSFGIHTVSADITLYAKWTPDSITPQTPAPQTPAPPSSNISNGDKNIGQIIKDQQLDKSVPKTNVNNSTEELRSSVFNTEELAKIEAGEDAKVILKVTDINNSISEVEKKLIAKNLDQGALVIYIDLSLYKKVGDGIETKITETKNKISISIEVPVELRSTDMAKNRTYQIIRIHEGEVTILKGVYDPDTNIFTFETDRFSTYALTYEETNTGKDKNNVTVTRDFFSLCLRAKATINSQKLTYNKVAGADGYIIYGAPCGINNKLVKLADVSGKITSYNHKNLKKAAYYKYQVQAYKLINGKKVVIAYSKVIHSVTISKTYDNPIKVESDTSAVILARGKAKKITCQVVLPKSKKMSNHTAAIRFETSNKAIATVSSSGKIKGIAKGTCYIYAYAQNGVYKKIKVTVK